MPVDNDRQRAVVRLSKVWMTHRKDKRMKRIIAIFAAVAIAVLAFASPARAASTEAIKAADWIVANNATEADWDAGTICDDLFALASTNDIKYQSAITKRVDYLKTATASYVGTNAARAAKMAACLTAVGENPKSFDGVNLITIIKDGIGADGSFSFPFNTGMAMVALARNGETIPANMITNMLTYRSTDGGFSWAPGQATYDPDMTSMAILGLKAAGYTGSELTGAIAFMEEEQLANGNWPAYSPINSTGLAGPLMGSSSSAAAASYVKGQQLSNGGLPNVENGEDADLMATQQGILALTNQTYVTITYDPAPASPSTSPSATSSTSPSATRTATATVTTTSTSSPKGELADTGAGVGAGLVALSVVAVGAGTVLLRKRPQA
jgi:hypothetical protein